MEVTLRINKKYYTVTCPEVSVENLSQEQLKQIVNKWHKNTVAYLTRLLVQREDTLLKENVERFNSLVEYAIDMHGMDPEVAKASALKMLQKKDPNFRLETSDHYTLSLDDLLNTLKFEEEEE